MKEEKSMLNITIDGKVYQYEMGTSLEDIVREHPDENDDVLLVSRDGKLCELHKKVTRDCSLSMITLRDRAGAQTYERSALLLFLKSFYEVVGSQNIERVRVDYTLSNGVYIETKIKADLCEALCEKVKARMRQIVDKKSPIMKKSINTDDAIELFHKLGMYDKEKLFRYRRVSRVNIYTLEGFVDYFYGYMVINAGYIKYFDLKVFEDGIVLLLPTRRNTKEIGEFTPSMKIFHTMKKSSDTSEKLNISNVGSLNEIIASGKTKEMIIIHEAMMERRIGQIAQRLIDDGNRHFIMIAGPSSSGKTTFSHRLSSHLWGGGKKPHPIALDNYFKNRQDTPRDEHGNYDFECLEAVDVECFNKDMKDLLDGKEVQIPRFDFIEGKRKYVGDYLRLGPDDVLVIEGIHGLNDKLSYALPNESKFKIYISALTQLNVDEHNRIPTTDGRLIRRIVRDARTRGADAKRTIGMWDSVNSGERKYIFPFQESADEVFNSALDYELALLKQYAEPLLFGVDRECKEYFEAKRLLKFLDYFLNISSEDVPQNSLIREFVGGSCFNA